jgi:DNA repair protein RadD
MLTPRDYQLEGLNALDDHLATRPDNPCVVLPTGSGKSFFAACAIERWKAGYPPFRVCILAHRKELVAQNHAEMCDVLPLGDIGIYAAGLNSKNTEAAILFASIDSIYTKAGEFTPFDAVIVDEAHRIPARGEGKYRQFIEQCKRFNKRLRVVGMTATPFRMEGPICHPHHILNAICYEVPITRLLAEGHLCPLRSKIGEHLPEMSAVARNGPKGDYIEAELEKAVNTPEVVVEAVREIVKITDAEHRRHIIIFCASIAHCEHVSKELKKYGQTAPFITAKTPKLERQNLAEKFIKGELRFLINVNVFTEGFNAKCVDAICLLRPTLSKSLYIQMVGRGLRIHPEKENCLVLDFAGCIQEHGPIDQIDPGAIRLAKCKGCGDTFSRAIRTCPNCGWTIPPLEVERMDAEDAERDRINHAAHADRNAQIISEPVWLDVDDVSVSLHKKPDAPDSLRVQYRCGLRTVSEWICLNHKGFARTKALIWWSKRNLPAAISTVSDAAQDFFLPNLIKIATKRIQVKKEGKFYTILAHDLSTTTNAQTQTNQLLQ